eukprot:8574626-Alexandrium_andersonii.AAC.1
MAAAGEVESPRQSSLVAAQEVRRGFRLHDNQPPLFSLLASSPLRSVGFKLVDMPSPQAMDRASRKAVDRLLSPAHHCVPPRTPSNE